MRTGVLLFALCSVCSLQLGVSAAFTKVPSPGLTRVVEVRDAADNIPYFTGTALQVLRSMPAAAEALVDHSASTKRTRQYVTPVGYNGTESGDLAQSMNLPNERDGLKLSRWVICSWVVANISARDALRNRNNVFLERIPDLLRSVQDLAPSQVYAVAAANVTLGFEFSGIESQMPSTAATAAIKKTASDMAGGYNEQLITVSTAAPAQSQQGSQVAFEGSLQDATGSASVVKRGKDLGQPATVPPVAPAAAAGRRLQHADGLLPDQLSAYLDQGSMPLPLPLPLVASILSRRLLQDKSTAAAETPAAGAGSTRAPVPVWLIYKHVAPANTTTLLTELSLACNVTPTVAVGFDFAPQPCGRDVKAALEGAGVKTHNTSYAQILVIPPSVSLSVRLAVGMTAAQVAAGTDVALAEWLAQPSTTQAVARMYAPDAVIRWLHTPEIWYQKNGSSSSALSPGAAAGIAVGCTAAACGAAAVAAWGIHRRKAQAAAAADDDKNDGTDSQSSGRRRRRQGKRRYLLPDAPRPDSQSSPDAGGAGASSSGAAAAGAAAEDEEAGGLGHDDDADMSPDQIRPQLRSLGDSVTSAVRFEQSDEEAGPEHSEADEDPNADPITAGPSTVAVAGAGAAAVAAAGAVAADAASSSRSAATCSRAGPSSRSVLEARAALVAEYQQQNQQPQPQQPQRGVRFAPGTNSSERTASNGSSQAARGIDSSMPVAVSPELAAAAEICSAVGTPNQESSLSPAATSSSADVEMTHRLLKPVDERAAAASAAAVAAAAALPQHGAVAPPAHRRSPFALCYNFDGLADAPAAPAPALTAAGQSCLAAAMASASAKAVALPPRRLPLSPVSTSSSDISSQSAVQGVVADGAQGTIPIKATAAKAVGSGFSSGNGGRQQQQQRVLSPTAVLARSSGSLGSSCLPSPAGDSSSISSKTSVGRMSPVGIAGPDNEGVGLQQLVSILPPCGATEGDLGGGSMAHARSLPSNGVRSNDSMCSSILQGATDSYESTLQLSSSLSGPVLQPSSTSQGPLSPTYSDRPPSLGFGSGSVGKHELGCGVAAPDARVRS